MKYKNEINEMSMKIKNLENDLDTYKKKYNDEINKLFDENIKLKDEIEKILLEKNTSENNLKI